MPTLEPLPLPDRTEVSDALQLVGAAVVDMLRDGNGDAQVPRMQWKVRQVGAHLASTFVLYQRIVTGEGSPLGTLSTEAVARHNDALAQSVLDGGEELADALAASVSGFVTLVRSTELPARVPYHGGVPMAPLHLCALMLDELLVHGYDIATALALPWPIEPALVDLGVLGAAPLAPSLLTDRAEGFTATFQVHLRGQHTYTFCFDSGTLCVGRDWDGPVDCHLSADPRTYLLVAYGRIGLFRPTLTGRVIAYGRRPWLATRLGSLIQAA